MSIEARFNFTRGDFTLDVAFEVPESGITAIFGHSGCGKTSLLRAIAGLDRHPGGTFRLGNLTWQDDARFIACHKRPLGYVFQEASLFSHLNVQANLEYGLKRIPAHEQKIALQTAVDLLGISALLHRSAGTLSGGERQRVAIARALAVSPRLLLMDEPLASLDTGSKGEILPYLESLHRELEIPVLYVSHAHEEVAHLADHLVLMEAGKVTATGHPVDLFTRLDLLPAHDSNAAAIIDAEVTGHDDDYQLTYLASALGRISVVRKKVAVGSQVRLQLAARDVSLTLDHQKGTSILNIFPAIVEEVTGEPGGQTLVRLQAKGVPVLSRITRKSASDLGLAPGKQVYAQIKGIALLN